MCRKRFNRSRIASSEDYPTSRRIHQLYSVECPDQNILEIQSISLRIRVPYTMVCGRKVPLNIEETKSHSNINIKWE